jgi:hypothetical protein
MMMVLSALLIAAAAHWLDSQRPDWHSALRTQAALAAFCSAHCAESR